MDNIDDIRAKIEGLKAKMQAMDNSLERMMLYNRDLQPLLVAFAEMTLNISYYDLVKGDL